MERDMNMSVWMIAVLVAWSMPALAFENIEADAAYDRGIKERIREEFSMGLKMLKAQAEGLGMAVREKDVENLKQHMYAKAILMGRCVDQAVTFKKTTSGNLLLDKYVRGCIDSHLKFIDLVKSRKSTHALEMCWFKAKRNFYAYRDAATGNWKESQGSNAPAPYDFLEIRDSVPARIGSETFAMSLVVTDYFAMRECYEPQADRDRFEEQNQRAINKQYECALKKGVRLH
jgi:hypothetical protein